MRLVTPQWTQGLAAGGMAALGLLACWLIIPLVLSFVFMPPAIASVHQYLEGNAQVMWRSLQTLRDERDRAWQLVLFKRLQQGMTRELHLRLVGFPGMVTFDRWQPLQISTRTDLTWQAPVTAGAPSAPHINEYDLLSVLRDLSTDAPLELRLPTQPATTLVVPPFVVQEWRRLAAQT